jgi:hypothetical protein
MKKLIFLILAFSLAGFNTRAGKGYEVTYSRDDNTRELSFTLGAVSIDERIVDGRVFSVIRFEGNVYTQQAGFAELPFIHAAVMLEPDRNVDLRIDEYDYTDIQLTHPLLPSRGVIYRNQDPSDIPYVIDPKSLTDTWYPAEMAKHTDPYILRDIRGTNVYVYPFRYNAKQNVLRVYHSVRVSLVPNATRAVNPLLKQGTVKYEMDAVYASVFINYADYRDDLTIGEMGDILVVVTARDEDAIEPYIQWKREKGFQVSKEVVATGTNVNSVVQNAYDANNDILYVQLVGDWADIKCNTLYGGSPPMDPQIGCVVGSDDYPDICVGRISSENPAHVTTQVNKVINFEKYPDMASDWYTVATGIGSIEGPGDDNEMDFEHLDVIYNDKLEPFTYDLYNPIYEPSGSISDVNAAVNGGTSVINYCGHGSPTSWGTTGFNNGNVAGLSNGDKLPWIVSVACNNGDFHTGTCFAEAWLRKDGGGAVMFLGGSISQPWNPPMRGQDYFADLYIGGYDYSAHPGQNGISTTEGRTTLGAIVFNGLVLMTTEAGSPSDWETAKTWNLFGDPSLQARSDVPAELLLSNNVVMAGIPYTTNITTSGGPVGSAMVTLSQNGEYYTGLTDDMGNITINHSLIPGDALFVVTAFNTETIYETITVVPSGGPYVVYSSHTVNDESGNGNGLLDYGESVMLSISLTNVGSQDALNVEVILSTADGYVTITDGTENYGTIPAGGTVEVTDGFALTLAGDVPDGHMILFNIESTGEDTWNSSFTDMAHAPLLAMGAYSIDDSGGNGNGKLDPGETVTISIDINNEGSADAFEVEAVLSSVSMYITIDEPAQVYGDIAAGDTSVQSYEVTADPETPAGHIAEFLFDMSAGLGVGGEDEFSTIVGQIPALVINMDGNNNSAGSMMACFDNLSVAADMVAAWPADMNLYSSVFVCLGVYPDNHVLTQAQGQQLADYLGNGGNLYMEGGDTWYYDQATPVHSMFNIQGVEDGSSDLSTILGQAGTFAEDLEYPYTGDNNWIDRIAPLGNAFTIFRNQSPVYNNAIAYDEGSYRTIGSSFEFGGLSGNGSFIDYLMYQYLNFFGIDALFVGVNEQVSENEIFGQPYPNPLSGSTFLPFTLQGETLVRAEVYRLNGQKVSTLADQKFPAGAHQLEWDAAGGNVAEGIYMLRLLAGEQVITRKLVVIR